MKRNLISILFVPTIFNIFFFISSCFTDQTSSTSQTFIIAHRGVHQPRKWNVNSGKYDCTAGLIEKTSHSYMENTFDSMEKAFELGADGVELDYRITKDKQLIIFHDYDLTCRTNAAQMGCHKKNGLCLVKDHDSKFIRNLHLAWNYTFDNGKTFPFREKEYGPILFFNELLANEKLAGKILYTNQKEPDLEGLKIIAKLLQKYPKSHWVNYKFILDDRVYKEAKKILPREVLFRNTIKDSISYAKLILQKAKKLDFTILKSCEEKDIFMTVASLKKAGKNAKYIVESVHLAGSKILVYPVNTKEELEFIKNLGVDFALVNRIDEILSP